MRKYSSIQNIWRKFVPFLLATQFGQQMALASRTEYLFSTVCSHLPMGHNLICHSPSHSPMLPLICQKSIYLPKEVSFADFTSHLPFAYYLPKGCLISRFQLFAKGLSLISRQKVSCATFNSLIFQTISHIYQKGAKKYLQHPQMATLNKKKQLQGFIVSIATPYFFFF